MMPGNSVSPERSFTIRLSRISDFTGRRARRPASTSLRSAPRVVALEVIWGILAGIPAGSRVPGHRLSVIGHRPSPSAIGYRLAGFAGSFWLESRVALVYAHRGGSALRPENTIAAFDHGLSLGADGLELDVHLSRDGVVVVHHDRTLERTTNGRGALSDRTADELAALDAGWTFGGPAFPFRGIAGGVPSFAAVLRRYPGIRIIVELKANDPGLAHLTIDEIRRADAVER